MRAVENPHGFNFGTATVGEWKGELQRAHLLALAVSQALAGPMQAGLDYARAGFAVFPCVARGKQPLTPHGWQDASLDELLIRRWAERWPNANVGIACGKISGLCVLDFDIKGGQPGLQTWRRMIASYGTATETVMVTTASGGIHFWYRYPATGCASRKSGRLGVEIKSDGTYVIAPPSIVDYNLDDPKNAGCPATGYYWADGPLDRGRLLELPF